MPSKRAAAAWLPPVCASARSTRRSFSSRSARRKERCAGRVAARSPRCSGVHGIRRAQEHRAFDDVLQLADVAGPVVAAEQIERLGGKAGDGLLVHGAGAFEEVAGEHGDVVGALAQRRHVHDEGGQAIVEILAEVAGEHLGLEVAVGGRDHAQVELAHAAAADALRLVLLQDAQQLDLQVRGEIGDLVEEDRAAVGEFELPGACPDGVGEGAAFVAEQLALRQPGRDRRAVDADQRAVARAG